MRIIVNKVENFSRGFGFILFKKHSSAVEALKCQKKHSIKGSKIECRPTLLREEIQPVYEEHEIEMID